MEITARLVADATVNTTRTGREVVNFRAVINDKFRTKDGEPKEVSTFFDCAYWVGTGIAQYLKKGMLIEASGRVGVSAWTTSEGQPRANLTFHCNSLKMHGAAAARAKQSGDFATGQDTDDLPF